MFTTYILKSLKNGKHYIGHTNDMPARLERHNQGRVKSTKNGRPWELIYSEIFKTKSEANRREFEIKSYKGGILFKKLFKLI
ncbi:MAG: GIY-YIG nuclease family protein [Patescibacteria group bacterium]|nr:GIY-YIG nuclease family protein [Patescibacteria group bacterium]